MQIVTGYRGQAHITSNDDQGRNQGVFGQNSYVLSVGSQFAPTLVSANELRIADGEAVMQGVHFRVDPSSFDSVTITNGTQGMNRKDLVVCRYTKDGSTGVENCEWVVIEGTPTSGTAARPSAVSGDILDGALVADMPFFEIVLSGINVTAVNSLFSKLMTMQEIQALAKTNESGISELNSSLGSTLSNSTNLDTLTLPAGERHVRYYHGQNIKNMSGTPSVSLLGDWPFCLELIPIGTSATYAKQVLHLYGTQNLPDVTYERTQTYVSGSVVWTPWVRLPYRSEIDALNSNKINGDVVLLASQITASGQYTLNESYKNYKLLYILMFRGSNIYSSVFDESLLGAGYIASMSQGGYNVQLSFTSNTAVSVTLDGASAIRIFGIK